MVLVEDRPPAKDTANGARRGEAAAFRARVEERLRHLEGQLEELKGRINGLLFFIASTVIAQMLMRVLA